MWKNHYRPTQQNRIMSKTSKKGNSIIGIGALTCIGIGLKKYGPKVAKALIKAVSK